MLFESLIFFLSSFLTFFLSIKDFPVAFLQQVIVVILLVLVFLSKKIFSSGSSTLTRTFKMTGLFLSTFLTQLFVFSTGGFRSPFLILLHLFTLAVSFLLSYQAGVVFIAVSVATLVFVSYLSPHALNVFKDDPGTGVVLMISFVVVVPLAQLLVRNYQLKDTISKALAKYLQIGEAREESILQNVNEYILVTDKQLKIISVNTAFEKAFKMHTIDVVRRDLLDVIHLTNSLGEPLVKEALSIDKLLINKTTILLKDFNLRLLSKMEKVVIQITPILERGGEVSQIMFVITTAKFSNEITRHTDLDQAIKRHREVGEVLKKSLLNINHPELATYAELFTKQEEDLMMLIEIEDHPVKQVRTILDVALICQRILQSQRDFAKTLNVPLSFNLPKEEKSELTIFEIAHEGSEGATTDFSFSHFAAPIDEKWFGVIVQKLLELSLLLSSSYSNPGVVLSLNRDENDIYIKIDANFFQIDNQKKDELFNLYYGSLGQTTNLKLGSGLEGYIAKVLALELDLILVVESFSNPSRLEFILKLAKNPGASLQIQT